MSKSMREPSAEMTHTINPKMLTEKSTAISIAVAKGLITFDQWSKFAANAGHIKRSPVKLTDSEAYDYLRNGVPLQDAEALTNLGISFNDLINDPQISHLLPGSINQRTIRKKVVYTNTLEVIHRLQESGVSAKVADKALVNGLQDEHLDQALNDQQLIEMFGRYRFSAAALRYRGGDHMKNDVLMGFVTGVLPYECFSNAAAADFDTIEYELRTAQNNEEKLKYLTKDRSLLIAIINKALKIYNRGTPSQYTTGHEFSPVKKLRDLVEHYGREVLDLDDPRIAGIERKSSMQESECYGLEAARYINEVHRIARNGAYGDTVQIVGKEIAPQEEDGIRVKDSYLQHSDLYQLWLAGVPADKSYDLLVNAKLPFDIIISAHTNGVADALASGYL